MEIVKIKVSELRPYKNNAKIHTAKQIEQIKKSIEAFGFNDPIAVWGENNLVVEGHGRLLAVKELGYEQVDCIRLDHLTEDERKAYTIAHNKITMNTEFDLDILSIEIGDLKDSDFDLDLTGFNDIEIMFMNEDINPDKYDNNEYKEYEDKAKELLGKHILITYETEEELNAFIELLKIEYKPNRTTYSMEEILRNLPDGLTKEK